MNSLSIVFKLREREEGNKTRREREGGNKTRREREGGMGWEKGRGRRGEERE